MLLEPHKTKVTACRRQPANFLGTKVADNDGCNGVVAKNGFQIDTHLNFFSFILFQEFFGKFFRMHCNLLLDECS